MTMISKNKAIELLENFISYCAIENDSFPLKEKVNGFIRETYGLSSCEKIVSLFNDGYTTRQIAEMVGRTRDSVNNTLNRYGIIIPKERRIKTGIELSEKTKQKIEYIKQEMAKGKTQSQIARELGITRQEVNQKYKKYIENRGE